MHQRKVHHGLSKLDLTTRVHSLIIDTLNKLSIVAKFGPDVLYTNEKNCSIEKLESTGDEEVFGWQRGRFNEWTGQYLSF